MSYNTKNYTEQGGETTHIGGKLVIDEGGSVEGLPSPSPSPLTLPVVIAETDENGYFGYTFRELWEMFNQNKLIFIFRLNPPFRRQQTTKQDFSWFSEWNIQAASITI